MTVTLIKAPVEWGVRHKASVDQRTHVDPRVDEADARVWLARLHWCGNRDAVLVSRRPGGPWRPEVTR